MKTVILCGGKGTRIRGVTENLPKPMVPIGNFPILWHIMKLYATAGHRDFVLCLGYKGLAVREFFLNYQASTSDFTIELGKKDGIRFHHDHEESDWTVTLAETGLEALTGARIKRIHKYVADEENFMLTYGDGLSDIDFDSLIDFHRSHGKILTVTGVRPAARFGEIEPNEDGLVTEFNEKPQATGGRISGGFFVCRRELFDYLDDREDLMFELDPMRRLVTDGQMMMFKHDGFWQCMDTYRDYQLLNDMWHRGAAPWKRQA